MGLLSYIERLRGLPVKERRQVATTWTVVLMVCVIIGWLVFTLSGISGIVSKPSTPAATSPGGIQAPYAN